MTVTVAGGADTRALGARLAKLLLAGDLIVLSGGLGAGKTTLTQGIGVGLGVRGAVTSPTFVIARVHPSEVGGPALVHVDAYRLGGSADVTAEIDGLDLDASLAESVTVVEWGEGMVEELTEDRLEVAIARDPAGADELAESPTDFAGDEVRTIVVTGVGARWASADLDALTG
ncbi:tRNA (adenosine(37)-N6)-threonylcarbamoyltransferase complex ATPase subunit type 1 TsaE [Embleya scabrispora]|uniref:tRNA (adenosine(37)-N6)-threonylcarbamoyltransferase complex ATPase subunit type 1 TsaE n=1 Tax=Embleya scabrispora TaxID=159449 RepID=UPI00036B4F38|nr:tRNA (adenosine(37)-N6)-threonylcarbamoyltransferase complex ATPase subunit type 1 TsaE [Embleya scabrispora]